MDTSGPFVEKNNHSVAATLSAEMDKSLFIEQQQLTRSQLEAMEIPVKTALLQPYQPGSLCPDSPSHSQGKSRSSACLPGCCLGAGGTGTA